MMVYGAPGFWYPQYYYYYPNYGYYDYYSPAYYGYYSAYPYAMPHYDYRSFDRHQLPSHFDYHDYY